MSNKVLEHTASTFRAEQFHTIKMNAYIYLHNSGIHKPDRTVSCNKIQPPISSAIMHVLLMQTSYKMNDE